MSVIERVSADQVTMPDGMVTVADVLSPCPNCGTHQTEAPEGVNADGTAVWQNTHCHKCGFRPGANIATNLHKLREDFMAFMEHHNKSVADIAATPSGAKSLTPPSDSAEVASLKAQLAALQASAKASEENPPFTDPRAAINAVSTAADAPTDAAPAVS